MQKSKVFTKSAVKWQSQSRKAAPLIRISMLACATALPKAKANNMPNDNIKRTLDKYSGANGQVDYEANNYEGYGVGGVAVVVETLTDNKNRTVADVRHLFDKYGAGLGSLPAAYRGSSTRRALSSWKRAISTRTPL